MRTKEEIQKMVQLLGEEANCSRGDQKDVLQRWQKQLEEFLKDRVLEEVGNEVDNQPVTAALMGLAWSLEEQGD